MKNNKLTSRKFWVTLWCMVLITLIVVLNRVEFMRLAELLAGAPFMYMGMNAYQKTHGKKENEIDDLQQ